MFGALGCLLSQTPSPRKIRKFSCETTEDVRVGSQPHLSVA